MSRLLQGGPQTAPPEARLEEIFRDHHDAVVAYTRRRVAAQQVDDVVSETFLVAWRRLDHVPLHPLPWLLAVARNVIATQKRGSLRREALAGKLRDGHVRGDESGSDAPATPVSSALGRLREWDREAITLIAWDELRPSEAAAVLGQSPVAFRVRLHRAKRRLRRELERDRATEISAYRSSVAREVLHE